MTIQLDILSLVPITYQQWPSCEAFFNQSGIGQQVHRQILSEYPKKLLEEQHQLSTLVVELMKRFGENIRIQVIDPQSLPGILRSLRYRVRKYPAFIVDGQKLIVGWDPETLTRALEERV